MQETTIEECYSSTMLLHNNGLYAMTGYAEIASTGEQRYIVRRLSTYDIRQSAYQQLRADIFVHKFGWDIPVDDQGRERDAYDLISSPHISVHCVFLHQNGYDYLVSGVRVCELSCWQDSMTFNEFRTTGMIPLSILDYLQEHYSVSTMLELTRLCVRKALADDPKMRIDVAAIRDYTYAAVYSLVEHSDRPFALAIVDRSYFAVLQRAQFVFTSIYVNFTASKQGYALIVIDLVKSIPALRAAGYGLRAERMLTLCRENYIR